MSSISSNTTANITSPLLNMHNPTGATNISFHENPPPPFLDFLDPTGNLAVFNYLSLQVQFKKMIEDLGLKTITDLFLQYLHFSSPPQTVGDWYEQIESIIGITSPLSSLSPETITSLDQLLQDEAAAIALLNYATMNNRPDILAFAIANGSLSRDALLTALNLSDEGSDLFLLGLYLNDPQQFDFTFQGGSAGGSFTQSNTLVNILDQLPDNSFSVNLIDLLIASKVPLEVILKYLLLNSPKIELLQYFIDHAKRDQHSSLTQIITTCYIKIANLSDEVLALLKANDLLSLDSMFEFDFLYQALQLHVPQKVIAHFIEEQLKRLQISRHEFFLMQNTPPLVAAMIAESPPHIISFLLEQVDQATFHKETGSIIQHALENKAPLRIIQLLIAKGAKLTQKQYDDLKMNFDNWKTPQGVRDMLFKLIPTGCKIATHPKPFV